MKYKVVNKESGVQPFGNEYETENKLEALKKFVIESENLTANLKHIKFTFKLVGNIVKEFVDGEFDGEEFIAKEEMM